MTENRLLARVVLQSMIDMCSAVKKTREEARAFLLGETGGLTPLCNALGLNESRIKTIIKNQTLEESKKFRKFIIAELKRVDQPEEAYDSI